MWATPKTQWFKTISVYFAFILSVYHRLVGGGRKMCFIVTDNVGGRLTCLKLTVSDKEEKGHYAHVLKAFSLEWHRSLFTFLLCLSLTPFSLILFSFFSFPLLSTPFPLPPLLYSSLSLSSLPSYSSIKKTYMVFIRIYNESTKHNFHCCSPCIILTQVTVSVL